MGFYDDMAEMTADLLKPDAEGGFGQGTIVLTKITPGVPSGNAWDKVAPSTADETLSGAAKGVSEEFVGMTGENGAIILATDLEVIAVPPALAYEPGDTIAIDGAPVTVLMVSNIPAAGTTVAVRFIVRN